MPNSADIQGNGIISSATATSAVASASSTAKWMMTHVKSENSSIAPGQLGLGLPSDHAASGLTDLMRGPPTIYGGKPATLDLLGLGMGPGAPSSDGISAYLTSMGGGLDVTAATSPFGRVNLGGSGWDDSPDRKPTLF